MGAYWSGIFWEYGVWIKSEVEKDIIIQMTEKIGEESYEKKMVCYSIDSDDINFSSGMCI